jgi:hypothetical protein
MALGGKLFLGDDFYKDNLSRLMVWSMTIEDVPISDSEQDGICSLVHACSLVEHART